MKKIICVVIAALMLSSCSTNITGSDENALDVVCTVFPAYDWIRAIAGDTDINLHLIPSNGTDIHSYQPSAEDIIKITECDLFVYSEGHEKSWYDDITIKEKFNMSVFNNHDEHVWLSPENAEELTEMLAEKLCALNPENKEAYLRNSEIYTEKLSDLDDKYEETIEKAKRREIIVADRFPFSYMTDEYKIQAYAAFLDCSAESEVSFETVAMLSEKLNELKLSSVITMEGSDNKIAQAVISNSNNKNVKILVLDSMQSVTSKELSEGLSYIEVMNKNLSVLKEALN